MARFVFKLEPVLRHRQRIEDEHKRAVGLLVREVVSAEQQLRSMQEALSEDKAQMADALIGEVDVRWIRRHAVHVNQATIRAQQIAGQLMGLHHRVAEARQTLLEASRARKVIEKLRQRHEQRWAESQQRRENRELDDLITGASARRILAEAE